MDDVNVILLHHVFDLTYTLLQSSDGSCAVHLKDVDANQFLQLSDGFLVSGDHP